MKLVQLTVRISDGNSKLGHVSNVSMTPIKSCANCASCKKDCYALKAYRMYPQTRDAWNNNFKMAKTQRNEYFRQIRVYLTRKAPKFFRWHVAGDILDQAYLDQMCQIAAEFPSVRFLAFAKMHGLDFGAAPQNMSIVLSMFPTMPVPSQTLPIAWMQDGIEFRMPVHALQCPGNCETCGMCFSLRQLKRDVVFHKH